MADIWASVQKRPIVRVPVKTKEEREANPSKADLIMNFVNAVSLDGVYVNGRKITAMMLAVTLLCMAELPTHERGDGTERTLKLPEDVLETAQNIERFVVTRPHFDQELFDVAVMVTTLTINYEMTLRDDTYQTTIGDVLMEC